MHNCIRRNLVEETLFAFKVFVARSMATVDSVFDSCAIRISQKYYSIFMIQILLCVCVFLGSLGNISGHHKMNGMKGSHSLHRR